MREIIIIGGGASGFAAAIMAAREGASVTILEKNEKPLRKLLLTGNGKCNISNLRGDADSFRSNLPDRARALYEKFNIVDTFAFFERLGIYITEKDGRAYPASESAASVAKLLMQEATALKVKIK
ncbi:MAG: NAD(P)/FAD-dependent oxidoreductase, partial [Lachnospiraceae bacterium]|nr:NAD(P)/FAD-dependent oxidoreductase [Lachnospiraceae bacterium]